MSAENECFYIIIKKNEDGKIEAHRLSSTPEPLVVIENKSEDSKPEQDAGKTVNFDFLSVMQSFEDNISIYRRFVPLMMMASAAAFRELLSQRLVAFCKQYGTKCDDKFQDNEEIFKVDLSHYRTYAMLNDEIGSMTLAMRHLPSVMIIGIISVYDNFLSKLLAMIFEEKEEVILTSEKTIKFSDLSKYASIDDAKRSIIRKEVESVVRLSHHDQSDWMEDKFKVKLKQGLLCWPAFIELCERRNLFTHTGGVVSAQYIANCKEHNVKIPSVQIGDRLTVITQGHFAGSGGPCAFPRRLIQNRDESQ